MLQTAVQALSPGGVGEGAMDEGHSQEANDVAKTNAAEACINQTNASLVNDLDEVGIKTGVRACSFNRDTGVRPGSFNLDMELTFFRACAQLATCKAMFNSAPGTLLFLNFINV